MLLQIAFQHVFHAPPGGKSQRSYPQISEREKHPPDNSTTPINSTEIEHGMTVWFDTHCTDNSSFENHMVVTKISASMVSIPAL